MREEKWVFHSESRKGVYYTVQKIGEYFVCNCPAYAFGEKNCRHIRLVMNGLPQNFCFDEPRIIKAHINRPVMVGKKILIPFYSNDNIRMIFWIIKYLRQFGISRRRCEDYFKLNIPRKQIMERKIEGIRIIEGNRFAMGVVG